jgi:cytoskeletal protein CcmA (bactofilin family)
MSELTTSFKPKPEIPRTGDSPASVIGPSVVIKGEISAEEDLMVMGRVEGTIDHNQRLTIHADGVINASIKAQEITVEGTVHGNIYGTKRVKICATAQVDGNVFAPSVGLVEGSRFKGTVDMEFDSRAVEQRFYESVGRTPPSLSATPVPRHDMSEGKELKKEKERLTRRAAPTAGDLRPKRPDGRMESNNPDAADRKETL